MKKLLFISLIFFSLVSFSQEKELISVWESNAQGSEYKLEIYFDKSVETLMSATMIMDNYPSYFILQVDENGKYIFYRKSTKEKTMYAVLKEVDGEDRLYFNGGNNYMVKTYSKSEEQ